MKWIEFEIQKPPKSCFYFVKGKHDNKAVMWYDANDDEWEINGYPTNKFGRSYIYWLFEP